MQVFSKIEATLSSALLDAIPGSKSTYLSNIEEECSVKLKGNNDDTFSFMCSENQIVNLYDKLSALVPDAKDPFRNKQQRHKGISCDLLRPMFSRSGREVKPKQFEIPIDDEPAHHDSDFETKTLTSVKRKRGRPPKQLKVVNDKTKRLITAGKQLTRGSVDETSDNVQITLSSQISDVAQNTEVIKSQTESEAPMVTLKDSLNVESHIETPSNIDAGSSSDGLRVEELVEPAALNFSAGTLNLDDDNMKALIKLDVEKATSSTSKMVGLSEENVEKATLSKMIGLSEEKSTYSHYYHGYKSLCAGTITFKGRFYVS